MIVYFHRLSASGLTANAIVVPVLSAIVPLGFMAIAANSTLLAHLCAWLLSLAKFAVGFHARWEPDWRIPAPPFWLAALFTAALIFAALRVKRARVPLAHRHRMGRHRRHARPDRRPSLPARQSNTASSNSARSMSARATACSSASRKAR